MRAADLAAPRLYAGYEMGYYCVRIKGDIELATLLPLQAKGYRLRFLQQANNLNYYAEQIAAHSKAIVKLNKVLDKLDRLLSQRKLNEFKG